MRKRERWRTPTDLLTKAAEHHIFTFMSCNSVEKNNFDALNTSFVEQKLQSAEATAHQDWEC